MAKDIFISHAWGNDSKGNDNHLKSKLLADMLISFGYSVWFDSYDMYGNIDLTIMSAINNCKVVIICLTENYFNKINNAVNKNKINDNCFKEWNYMMFKEKKIIPIIIDSNSKNLYLNEAGIIQMYLSNYIFINFSENFIDDRELLFKTLINYNVYNCHEKKIKNLETNISFNTLFNLLNEKMKTFSSKKDLFCNIKNRKKGFNRNILFRNVKNNKFRACINI